MQAVCGRFAGGLRAVCGRFHSCGGFRLSVCVCQFAFGGLRLAVCVWRLTFGGLRAVRGRFAAGFICGGFRLSVCVWQFAFGGLRLALDAWQFAIGGLRLAVCAWRFALGGSRLAVRAWRFAGGLLEVLRSVLREVYGWQFAGGLRAASRRLSGDLRLAVCGYNLQNIDHEICITPLQSRSNCASLNAGHLVYIKNRGCLTHPFNARKITPKCQYILQNIIRACLTTP